MHATALSAVPSRECNACLPIATFAGCCGCRHQLLQAFLSQVQGHKEKVGDLVDNVLLGEQDKVVTRLPVS